MSESRTLRNSGSLSSVALRWELKSAAAMTLLLASVSPVFAHEVPDGSEWVMADWMLLSFVSFFGAALIVFLIAVRRGLFRHLEDAKYHLLSVDEPDYYTPDWAKEDSHAPIRK